MVEGPKVTLITRDQVREALKVLGIDIGSVRSVHIEQFFVEVEFLVRNNEGKLVAAGNEVARCRMQIPVDDQFERKLPATNGNGETVVVEGVLD
jgi:hypothetical protein